MSRWTLPALVLLGVLAAVPTLVRGGAPRDPHSELARIERDLDRIEARVLEGDAELRAMNQALGAEMLAAMEAASPGAADAARRLAALRGSPGEARRLEAVVAEARVAALRDERLALMVEAFHHLLRERMVRAEPAAGPLLRRYGELQTLIAAAEP